MQCGRRVVILEKAKIIPPYMYHTLPKKNYSSINKLPSQSNLRSMAFLTLAVAVETFLKQQRSKMS